MGYFLGKLSAGKGANGINICFGGGMFSPAELKLTKSKSSPRTWQKRPSIVSKET
jgi:hypothetical protein